ncbi:TetR/AcrR family transcriptional regulator [Pseudoduganella chitinolytica]|uniref:Helix-turn-helix domain containing protein n=1 Tax=Pseudoduganella chitinolytica TaxID=34070 RepID=A0ABY8BHW2_9BURK|nr:TetR/AcrR family transcriptional regulator [Pseudoduganella chitinolytica]WEF34282.1 helix-turn-helix domain containing protein [Pseudoduganella chitinolytica]
MSRKPSAESSSSASTPRRSDAVQNRDRLLDAAEAVFLQEGVQAPLDAVAQRAGVGRATLFRHFADRHALIAGLLERTLATIEGEAARGAGDPYALARLLRFLAQHLLARAPLTEYWQACDHDSAEFQAALARFVAAFEGPVAAAVAAGTCRADFQAADVVLLASLLGGALYARAPGQRSQLAARAWQLMVQAAQLREPAAP